MAAVEIVLARQPSGLQVPPCSLATAPRTPAPPTLHYRSRLRPPRRRLPGLPALFLSTVSAVVTGMLFQSNLRAPRSPIPINAATTAPPRASRPSLASSRMTGYVHPVPSQADHQLTPLIFVNSTVSACKLCIWDVGRLHEGHGHVKSHIVHPPHSTRQLYLWFNSFSLQPRRLRRLARRISAAARLNLA